MRAMVIGMNGGPEVLEPRELDDPDCPADGLMIAVEAIGVESADLVARATRPPKHPPLVLGAVAAGTVLEVGAAVRGSATTRIAGAGAQALATFQPGDRVVTLGPDGAYATRRAVPTALAWPLPDGLEMRAAACVPIAFGSAFEALFNVARLEAGETVLIHAGSGGIGIAAIQLAKLAGATVIATASNPTKLERLAAFGLDHGIDDRQQDVVRAVRKLLGITIEDHGAEAGVDVVLDNLGGARLAQSLDLLRWRGRLVTLGGTAGQGVAFDPALLWPRAATLHGVRLATVLRHEPARAHAMIAECLARVASGELRVPIAKAFPLDEAAAAHAYIEERRAFGRVVLVT